MRSTRAVVFILFVVAACGGRSSQSPTGSQELLLATVAGGRTIMKSGPEAIREFRTQVEPWYEEGECMAVRNEPAPGVRTLTVHFPNGSAPQTSVSITLDADSTLLRYVENRGMPKPSKDLAAIQEELRSMPRTIVTLDYVTGQAIAHNMGSEEGLAGVRGGVSEFEGAGVVWDIPTHVSVVKELCAAGVNSSSRGWHGG